MPDSIEIRFFDANGDGVAVSASNTRTVRAAISLINPASFGELRALPGMGDEYVRRVISFRPYTAKSQLATKGILPEAEYERIQELIVAHSERPKVDKKQPLSSGERAR